MFPVLVIGNGNDIFEISIPAVDLRETNGSTEKTDLRRGGSSNPSDIDARIENVRSNADGGIRVPCDLLSASSDVPPVVEATSKSRPVQRRASGFQGRDGSIARSPRESSTENRRRKESDVEKSWTRMKIR